MKSVVGEIKQWLTMEVEYLKLTAAEKVSLLVSTLVLAIVMFILFSVVMIVLAFALVDLFCLIMPHSLACLTVGGILMLLIGVIYLLRKPLLIDPITKLITKLFLTPKKNEKKQ